jgi:hypothetical protein
LAFVMAFIAFAADIPVNPPDFTWPLSILLASLSYLTMPKAD